MNNRLALTILTLLVLGACHTHGPGADHSHDSTESTAGHTEPAASEVTYVPAYPEDVSADSLSDDDIEQQEATHSHGGEEHSHGDDASHDHDADTGDGHGHDHDEDGADHVPGR